MSDAIELLERGLCYSGFLTLVRYRLRHCLYGGGWGEAVERECLALPDAAAVLLYDAHLDQVVMVEQFRIGGLASGNAWLIEPAGGVISPGCDPVSTGLREVHEETGCEAWGIEPIASFFVSPGFTSQRLHLFCASTDASRVVGSHGLAAEGEDTRVVVLDACYAIAGIGAGRLGTMPAIIGLQWLALNRTRLRADRTDPARLPPDPDGDRHANPTLHF